MRPWARECRQFLHTKKGQQNWFSFRGSIRNHPCQHLDCSQENDFKLLTFGTVKMVHLCWLNPLVCGNVLWQRYKIDFYSIFLEQLKNPVWKPFPYQFYPQRQSLPLRWTKDAHGETHRPSDPVSFRKWVSSYLYILTWCGECSSFHSAFIL